MSDWGHDSLCLQDDCRSRWRAAGGQRGMDLVFAFALARARLVIVAVRGEDQLARMMWGVSGAAAVILNPCG